MKINRLAKLSEFVRKLCLCPCCGEEEKCAEDCIFDVDCPVEYDSMMEAREIYWGMKKPSE